jgi:hypothetical protein
VSEWEAALIAKSTAVLTVEDRAEVDAQLAGSLGPMGPRQIEAAANALAYQLDPMAFMKARRLLTDPVDGTVIGRDSRQRCFTGAVRALITTRDQICRTPWCAAPIRHLDHVTPHAGGGPTTFDNVQGLCQRCNHAKQAPGWTAETLPGPRHTVRTTTPTGHRYTSTAPPLPGRRAAIHAPPIPAVQC